MRLRENTRLNHRETTIFELRECKRHTARRVVSTPSVVLTGYLPPPRLDLAGYPPPAGYPPRQGTPPAGPGRVPPWQGTPPGRVPPQLDLAGYPPAGPGRVPPCPPQLDLAGYPPPPRQLDLAGYLPLGVCPMAFWVMLQSIMGYGYLPPLGVD